MSEQVTRNEQVQLWFANLINERLKALHQAYRAARSDMLAAEIQQEIDMLLEIEERFVLVAREDG